MQATTEQIVINSSTVERGYKNCRHANKKFYKDRLWVASNLPGDQRQALDAVLYNLMRTLDLLDLESADGRALDIWHEVRDELSDAFRDKCASAELAALVDATRRFQIPKQFLFDPLRGADLWIRNHQFETYAALESFCSYVGGSALASAMPTLGVIRPGYEIDAIECGKAIMLTQLLANCIEDVKRNQVYLALEDFEDCGVEISHLKIRRTDKTFRFLVRLYVSRIEKLFMGARNLVNHLDFDGKRSLKSLLTLYWQMLIKMQVEPECILADEGVLSGRELLFLKSRHLMGMEKEVPICADEPAAH